jgi:uncharacterized RDD family membrane protein YckC
MTRSCCRPFGRWNQFLTHRPSGLTFLVSMAIDPGFRRDIGRAPHAIIAPLNFPTGVYFLREEYAPFWVRVLVDLIDLAVFSVACGVLTMLVTIYVPFTKTTLNLLLLMCITVALLYFVVLKRSNFRTLGYRLGRVRITGLDGEPPSYGALIFRLMFSMLGPFNWALDLIWASNDVHRQALRDKLANTYVVKAKAQPAGRGRIVVQYYDICFYNFLCREVVVNTERNIEEPTKQSYPKMCGPACAASVATTCSRLVSARHSERTLTTWARRGSPWEEAEGVRQTASLCRCRPSRRHTACRRSCR